LGRDRDELIKNIKANVPDNEQLSKIEKLAENYKDKTDDEIFFEIIKINKEMENELSPEKYNEILEKIESIRPLLSKEQSSKLNMILKALDKNK
jgi:hypothetical protein